MELEILGMTRTPFVVPVLTGLDSARFRLKAVLPMARRKFHSQGVCCHQSDSKLEQTEACATVLINQ